jgi:DNA polymerase kappa
MIAEIEKHRNHERACCVLDLDAFYASCEERDRPQLKEQPMAVGGMGMICTANYKARTFGVRSAMPGFIGELVRG